MATNYVIVTDSTANLTTDMIEEYGIEVLSLNYYVDGNEIKGYEKGKEQDLAAFYHMMREQKEITTSLPSMEEAEEVFEKILGSGKDALYIGFSSGLSGTFQSVSLVAEQVLGKYPDRKVISIDSLAAALGEGLLVHYAVQNQQKGMTLEENAQWVKEHIQNLCHWFTVDDLFFLKRGGRISAATAVVGSVLSIKPVLHVDCEGHLIAKGKVRGRKKALDSLVQHMEETVVDSKEQLVCISHGDCLEDAEYVAGRIKEKFGVKEVLIHILDPVIGAHAGPGTVALFYLGRER